MDLHDIREDYSKQELSKADCADTPLPQFEKWLNEAIHSAVKEPTAMSVATVDEAGRPNSRILLLKEVNDRGFVFFSNYQSWRHIRLPRSPFSGRSWSGRCAPKGGWKNWTPNLQTNISPAAPTPAVWARGLASRAA